MSPDDIDWVSLTEEEAKAELEKIHLRNPGLTLKEALKRSLRTPRIEPGKSYGLNEEREIVEIDDEEEESDD